MNLNCEKISEVLKSVIGTLSSDESFGGDLNIRLLFEVIMNTLSDTD